MAQFDEGLILGMLLSGGDSKAKKKLIVDAINSIEGADVNVDVNDSWEVLAEILKTLMATGRVGRAKDYSNIALMLKILISESLNIQEQAEITTQPPSSFIQQDNAVYSEQIQNILNSASISDIANITTKALADGDYFDEDVGYTKNRYIEISEGTMQFIEEGYGKNNDSEIHHDEGTIFVLDIERDDIKTFEHTSTIDKTEVFNQEKVVDNSENFNYDSEYVVVDSGISILYPEMNLTSSVSIVGDDKIFTSTIDKSKYKGLELVSAIDETEEIIEVPINFSDNTQFEHDETYIDIENKVDLVYSEQDVLTIPNIIDNGKTFTSTVDLTSYKYFDIIKSEQVVEVIKELPSRFLQSDFEYNKSYIQVDEDGNKINISYAENELPSTVDFLGSNRIFTTVIRLDECKSFEVTTVINENKPLSNNAVEFVKDDYEFDSNFSNINDGVELKYTNIKIPSQKQWFGNGRLFTTDLDSAKYKKFKFISIEDTKVDVTVDSVSLLANKHDYDEVFVEVDNKVELLYPTINLPSNSSKIVGNGKLFEIDLQVNNYDTLKVLEVIDTEG